MTTDVRTFQAENMREALERVRAEMGGDAVILHTRQIPARGLLPWNRRQDIVEITAGTGGNVKPKPPLAARSAAAQSLLGTTKSTAPTAGNPPSSEDPRGTAKAIADALMRSRTTTPVSNASIESPLAAPAVSSSSPDINTQALPGPSLVELKRQLDSIQALLTECGLSPQRTALTGRFQVPLELRELHAHLQQCDVTDDVTQQLLQKLMQITRPEHHANPQQSLTAMTGLIESELRIAPPISVQRGRRKVVALVGATGVGKTTTIAKLAANFRLRDGIRMGLVTVDTYRIAAVEQLRTYAEIIDLPMRVVTNPLEMQRALDELAGLDLVLIDTAGRSPRDELQVQELKRLLSAAKVDEVHLVLSMTSSLRSMLSSARQFSTANAGSLILTKLDEAGGLGSLLTLSREVDLPITYLTTGQDVPDDIEPARADRLARLILGREPVGN